MATPNSLGQHVLERCGDLGFALAGVTEAAPSARSAELRAWLAAGHHGTMAYLARNVELREDVRQLLPGAKSVVMVADQYATRNDPPDPQQPWHRASARRETPAAPELPIARKGDATDPALGGSHGRIARYARGRDYHREIKRRLHALCDELRAEHTAECRVFCDTAPAPERELAADAGLGWIGKHTLLIHPRLGSYLLLGGFVTTLDLLGPPAAWGGRQSVGEAPPERALGALAEVPDACGTCTRCIDACPTEAITAYSVNASRCISYLTIERREALPEWSHGRLAGWAFGCDICQEVCPHNSPRPEGVDVGAPNPAYAPARVDLELRSVLDWTHEDRAGRLAGSAMKRASLPMLKRTAVALLADEGAVAADPGLRGKIREIAAAEGADPGLRDAARRALALRRET